MRIAIEAQRIFRKKKHGMDIVVLEMVRELQKLDQTNEYFILVSPGVDRCLQETANFHIVEVGMPTYPLWEQIALPLALRKIQPDLLHCTSNTAPYFCKAPLILTLHDIIFLEKRTTNNTSFYQNMGWWYRRLVVPKILPKCRKIITVSQFECNRIRETLHLDADKIISIYNGFSAHFKPVADPERITNMYVQAKAGKYFFFLGNTDPKKNVLRTLKAYALYVQKVQTPYPLLVADLDVSVVDAILKTENIEEIRPYIQNSGYIQNTDLPAIYSGARAFIYTSLRESFGIPILEAMACGTPVLTSDTSSMPEVAGENALLVNPYNETEIADGILRLHQDDELCAQQAEYGLQRAKLFSWKNTAEQVLTVYSSFEKYGTK